MIGSLSFNQFFYYFTFFCAAGFFVSGIDDFIFDVAYLIKKFLQRKEKKLSLEDLEKIPQAPIAIMIPAWREENVIDRMVNSNISAIDYLKYDIFIGVYPNDEETIKKVNICTNCYPNVNKVVCKFPGPTTKADNLNNIYRGIREFEKIKGIRYEIFVMHDAEDIIHPKELKFFNYHLPGYDFVQIPVFPLESPFWYFTYGMYIDEFAESHLKDLDIRCTLAKYIPTAGVGVAFSRDTLESLKEKDTDEVFNKQNLTEDYEIGIKLGFMGKKGLFSSIGLVRTLYVRRLFSAKKKLVKKIEYIATRAFFPRTIASAIKQRVRWCLGITFQSWKYLGWGKSFIDKYTLWRDRKSLLVHGINLFGYVVFFYCFIMLCLNKFFNFPWDLNIIFPYGSLIWWLVLFDSLLLVWRLCCKFYAVNHIYGLRQAWMSIPRSFWRNIINFISVTKALGRFSYFVIKGEGLNWEKTEHVFPTEEEMKEYKMRLGELLLENKLITFPQLEQALKIQFSQKKKLGEVLIDLGYISEDDFLRTYCQQINRQSIEVDPYTIDVQLLRKFPQYLTSKYLVLPVGKSFSMGDLNEKVVIASVDILSQEAQEEIERVIEAPIEVKLATKSDIVFALDRVYMELISPGAEKEKIGSLLIKDGKIDEQQLLEGLRLQRRKGGKLGEILISLGYINEFQLADILNKVFNLKFTKITSELKNNLILKLIPAVLMKTYKFLVFYKDEARTNVIILSSRPLHHKVIAQISSFCREKNVEEGWALEVELEALFVNLDSFFKVESIRVDKMCFEFARINLSSIDSSLRFIFPENFLRQHLMLPIQLHGKELTIAVGEGVDCSVLAGLHTRCPKYCIEFVIGERGEINAGINKIYS